MAKVNTLSDHCMMMDDNNNYKLKHPSIHKNDNIACDNFNLNLNGLNVDAIPEPLSSLLECQERAKDKDIGTGVYYGDGKERFVS
jgi:hypothetical protein